MVIFLSVTVVILLALLIAMILAYIGLDSAFRKQGAMLRGENWNIVKKAGIVTVADDKIWLNNGISEPINVAADIERFGYAGYPCNIYIDITDKRNAEREGSEANLQP